jgi:SpoVK/Ycf46/Vps4 family AAA+-type ATPase
MPSGDALRRLFKSYKQLDADGFHAAAYELINEEKQKKHNILARDLQRILENGNGKSVNNYQISELQRLPKDTERGTLLFDIKTPTKYLSDIVLDEKLQQQVGEIIDEFNYSEVLLTHGMSSRRKLLFAGPPGCGKTLCSQIIASELGLPMLYTRFDAVISSYLGETASNLRKVFDFAQSGTWVVFFDEFDAIGKSRDDLSEHGELKRVVNTFLQLLDGFGSDSLFIAATNHESLLDNALWRRFDDILFFDKPNPEQIRKLLNIKLASFSHKKLDVEPFLQDMKGWSHADVEHVCIDSMKMAVLSQREEITNDLFKKAIEKQKYRDLLIKKSQRK